MLRNKTTKQVYLVVLFTLYLKEDVNEDGSLKPEAAQGYTAQTPTALDGQATPASNTEDDDIEGDAAVEEARKHLSDVDLSSTQKGKSADTQDDDID